MNRMVEDTLTLFRREALRYRRDRAYWVGQAVFPVAVVAVIGSGLNEVVSLPTGAAYLGHLASGILMLTVGSGAVGGGFTLIEDRQSGFLRALQIAPVSRTSIVLSKLAARTAASLALVFVLVAILAVFTPLRIPSPGGWLVGIFAIAAVSAVFVSMGIAVASRLRRMESFRLVAALVTVPLYLFSGIFYPISTMPVPMRILAHLNPLTYGTDLLRYALLGVREFPLELSVFMLGGVAIAATGLAVAVFEGRRRSA
jgi:ABC-2 type transport system permease protein